MFEGLISLKTDVVFGRDKTCKLYVTKSFTRHYFFNVLWKGETKT